MRGKKMKIVFTDIKTLGYSIDVSSLSRFGDLKIYDDLPHDDIGKVLLKEVPDVSAIITNASILREDNLKDLKHLKLICEAGTGYNNIDVKYCKQRGIAVTNVPEYAGNSVAQFTFAMLFYILSHLGYYDKYTKDGRYSLGSAEDFSGYEFHELEGKTWGIIGLGNIGTRVARYAECFGCKVIYHSITGRKSDPKYERVSFNELLTFSDILSIHAPLSDKTRNLITMSELSKMKKKAILLNLGRGGIVNEKDLAAALDEELIMGAALDVTENEPIEQTSPLLKLKNPERILITPHIAYGSAEARQRLVEGVKDSIKSYLEGGNHNRVV
jgi:lactate dehydrogenase-like 2-hydroxyacid dehydrogenase